MRPCRHGTHEYHGGCITNLKEALKSRPEKLCAIALDTKGPEIRTGLLVDHQDVTVEAGSTVIVTCDPSKSECGTAGLIYCDYPQLPETVKPGMAIFIDDGLLKLEVVECHKDSVLCRASNTSKVGERKGMNLPGASLLLPAVSEKDKSDILFGVEMGIDVIFASFIRKASQVMEIKDLIRDVGPHVKIFSKIENQEGLDNLDEILAVTDGVMVARGDLGIEVPLAQVFTAQKTIIEKCNASAIPVICATQMLESMTTNPRPTRAEVSDVGNAILDGADCVMLSGETAKGKYPEEAVRTMAEICVTSQRYSHGLPPAKAHQRAAAPIRNSMEAVCAGAASITQLDKSIGAILVVSEIGTTERYIAKYRPTVPVFTITSTPFIARQALLTYGLWPVLVDEITTVSAAIGVICKEGLKGGFLKPGSQLIAIYDSDPTDGVEEASNIRIVTV
eukprot:NODE_1136_length_1874_cov_17.190748_g1077_i0.p1 GENE.NODE_1136_length_1874_cov_17.190748_g1077_i0~~NODE_1136_length_1874_cov_17.190748_g1077_i0.p1  ORF type:complete len:449 (+),score=81.51 NODE_1136_length_1874_cov_17.190748_g1077_i0:211-1557(+)